MADEKSEKSRSLNEPELEKGTKTHSPIENTENFTSDNNIVDWESPDDPENPQLVLLCPSEDVRSSSLTTSHSNWTTKAKGFNTSLVIVLCLLTPLASSMFAPGVPSVLRTFAIPAASSATLAELVVSIYILGFAVGPLIISPLSEIYGRYPVYAVCNVMFIVFTVACAVSQSITQLIVFRFFAGCFGVCPVTLGGATISDLIPQEKRGASMSLFGMGPLMGPVIGPICGAYVTQDIGWRWTFWIIAIAYSVFTLTHAFLCRETYAPVLLARKTAKLQKETGNTALRSKLDDGLTKKRRIQRAIVRPIKMLLFSSIVSLMAVYCAVVYGVLYLLYTTYTFVFEEFYGFSTGTVGLVYIGSGVGMLIGLFIIGGSSDRLLKRQAAKHDGELKPEYRLLPLMGVCWLIPTGLFIYGWTVQYHEQWAIPLFGTLLFGIGIIAVLICIQQYLIDAFTIYAASAVAANTVLRSIVGGVLPLAGLSMYEALGFGWGNSLIAFISLVMIPIPFAFYAFGERIRKSTKVTF